MKERINKLGDEFIAKLSEFAAEAGTESVNVHTEINPYEIRFRVEMSYQKVISRKDYPGCGGVRQG